MLYRYRPSHRYRYVHHSLLHISVITSDSGVGAARNGANLILHHLGESTQSDIQEVEKACRDLGAKTVIVPGDIASQETASAVSP